MRERVTNMFGVRAELRLWIQQRKGKTELWAALMFTLGFGMLKWIASVRGSDDGLGVEVGCSSRCSS